MFPSLVLCSLGLPCRVTACRNPHTSCPAPRASTALPCSSSLKTHRPSLGSSQASVELFGSIKSHALHPREGLLQDEDSPEMEHALTPPAEHHSHHQHYCSAAGSFVRNIRESEWRPFPVRRSRQGAKQQPRGSRLSSFLTTLKWREE